MIRILVDNTEIYLEPNFNIRMDLISPAFEDEFDYSSIVYPFSIPAPPNEELFNFSNHIVINNKLRMYDCQVIFAGSLRMTAKLIISKLSSKQFRGSIIVNRFSTDYKDKLLNKFSYGGEIEIGNTLQVIAHVNGIVINISGAPLKYNFPEIKAPEFYGDKNEENPAFCGILNRWDRENQSVQMNSIGTYLDAQNTESLLPCPYLFYILEQCFKESGYSIFGSFLENSELQSLLMLNNYPLDEMQKLYYVRANNSEVQQFKPDGYINADDDYTPPNEDDHDIWDQSVPDADPAWRYHIQTKGYHEFSLKFKAKYTGGWNNVVVRISIMRYNNGTPLVLSYKDVPLGYSGVWYEDTVKFNYSFPESYVGEMILFDAYFFDEVLLEDAEGELQCLDLIIMNVSASGLNSYAESIFINKHVPKISLGDFVNALIKGFGVVPFYSADRKEVQFSTCQEILDSSESLDLSDQYIKDSEEVELKEKEGYKLSFEFDSNDPITQDNFIDHSIYDFIGSYATYHHLPAAPDGLNKIALVKNTNRLYFYGIIDEAEAGWSVFSDNHYDYLFGDGKNEVKIGLSPVMMHHDREEEEMATTIRPITKLLASSPSFGTGLNDFGFQIMFFRGLKSDGALYPLGSSTAYGPPGDSIGEYELQLPGDMGLVENFLKDWYNFLSGSQPVKMNFDVGPVDLINIMQLFLTQRGKQKRKILVNGVKYLPKKFSFILGSNTIEKAEATLVKKGNINI